ncbi:DUF2189 domain-containing protein [Rhodobacteraceae bacterium NNCM2]|nr:DUF2189 domain-containing protein [Coraliihabitans acroporae]
MSQSTKKPAAPVLKPLGVDNILYALRAGFADFTRAPLYGLFFGAVFSVIGIIVSWLLIVHASSYWVLPIAAGFPLIGPFAALGLYEVSRRLEAGEALTWSGVLGAVRRESRFQLPSYAFVVLFIYLIWVYLAHLIFALSFGLKPMTNVMTSADILLTGPGITMLLVGTLVGGALAVVLFAVSAVSVPMLLDRDIDIVSAMVASVRLVLQNQKAMLLWGAIIAISVAVAMIPLFLGMIVVFPVLGHASWHIYRQGVAPEK